VSADGSSILFSLVGCAISSWLAYSWCVLISSGFYVESGWVDK
jgi:hypothetical protein